jgi:hypothetical protein
MQKTMYLFFTLVMIVSGILISDIVKNKQENVNYEEIKDQVYNVSAQPAYSANTLFNDYAFYFPPNYQIVPGEEVLMYESNNAVFVINFGYDYIVDENFVASKNPGAKLEYQFINKQGDEMQYYVVWDHEDEPNSKVDYKDVLIGTNDRFIEATVPVNELEKYSIDSAYILNSVKKIDEN